MRQAFITTLERLARENSDIFLLNGDLGFSILENFNRMFPRRSLNMGVSEANLIGAAAGIALEGKTVFVYSIVPFVTMRVFEQVRNDVALQKANVKIVGVGCGFTYGQLGPTHHSIEDLALMRTLPNMTVFAPGDPEETVFVTEAAARIQGPVYIRIGKKGDPQAYEKKSRLSVGKGVTIRKGKDCMLIATGNMLFSAVEVSELLKKKGISVGVVSLHTIKPLDTKLITRTARESGAVFTLEEHSVLGGLGGAVAETLLESGSIPKHFYRFGVRDIFTTVSGTQEYLRGKHGLLPEQISAKILQILKKR